MFRLARIFSALHRNRSGVAFMEFALAFPVLLIMYVGSFVLMDAMGCYRKVTIATKTVADITSRSVSLSTSELNGILNASAQLMQPYSVNNAKILIAQVQVTGPTKAKIMWSRGKNTPDLAANTGIVIPRDVAVMGTILILGRIEYSYNPPVNFGISGPLNFADQIIMNPRLSDQITRN